MGGFCICRLVNWVDFFSGMGGSTVVDSSALARRCSAANKAIKSIL